VSQLSGRLLSVEGAIGELEAREREARRSLEAAITEKEDARRTLSLMEVELREAERKLQEEKKKVEEISVELVNLSIRAGRSDDVVPLTRNIQPSFPTADVGLQTIPIQPSLSEDSRSQNIQIERLTQRLSDFEALLSEKTDEARAFEKKSEAASLRADEALTKYRTSILSKMQTLMKGQDDTVIYLKNF